MDEWILGYVDVNPGDTFAEVEDRCLLGWEPFAITYKSKRKFVFPIIIKKDSIRFWLKKRIEPD